MDPELSSEWNNIEESVTADFRERSFINVPRCRALMQYLVMPSFEAYRSWDVLRQFKDDTTELIVVESVWHRNKDLPAFVSPVERNKHPFPFQPTVDSRVLAIVPSTVQDVLDRFANVQVCAFPREMSGFGCDGTIYELQFGEFMRFSRFVWWESLPEEWSQLQLAIDRMVRFFNPNRKRRRR